jgi:hypothetical protein
VNEREITLDVYALTEASLPAKVGADGEAVRTRPDWLPRQGAKRRYFWPSLYLWNFHYSPAPTGFLGNQSCVIAC